MSQLKDPKYMCDDCGGTIIVDGEKDILSREREYRMKPATEYYFQCPHCSRIYVVRQETEKIRSMQDELQRLQGEIQRWAPLVAKGTTRNVLKKYNALIQRKDRLWWKMVAEHEKMKQHFRKVDEKESKSLRTE